MFGPLLTIFSYGSRAVIVVAVVESVVTVDEPVNAVATNSAAVAGDTVTANLYAI